ncbi:MAG: hypothetical protein R2941_05815 [Desulfobacterales bacterium]
MDREANKCKIYNNLLLPLCGRGFEKGQQTFPQGTKKTALSSAGNNPEGCASKKYFSLLQQIAVENMLLKNQYVAINGESS